MRNPSQQARRMKRGGFSLMEVVIAVFLVGMTLTASLKSLEAVLRTQRVGGEQRRRLILAQGLMDEILKTHYEDPVAHDLLIGPEVGETLLKRSGWDDVDDFHGWSASPPQAADGSELPGLEGWSRLVSVEYVQTQTHDALTSDTDLKRITVQVASPDGDTTVLKALRSRWGLLEQKPSPNSTFVVGLEAELQSGADTRSRVHSETTVVNRIWAE